MHILEEKKRFLLTISVVGRSVVYAFGIMYCVVVVLIITLLRTCCNV